MKLNREDFIKVIDRICEMNNNQIRLNNCLKEIGADGYIFYPDGQDIILDLLKAMYDDKNDWIDYFYVDMDFGAKYKPGSVLIGGEQVTLRDAGDLYDLLNR